MSRTKDIEKNVKTCLFKEIQEAIKKFGAERNASNIYTARLRTASRLEKCSESAKSTGANDVPYRGVDSLYNNEPARPVYTMFCQHDCLKEYCSSVSSVVGLDAVMTDCIMSLESTFHDASSSVNVDFVQLVESVDLNSKTLRSRIESSNPPESASRLKELLTSVAVIILQPCLKQLRTYVRDRHQSEQEEPVETSVHSRGTTTGSWTMLKENHTLWLQYLYTKHFYSALIVHVFKEIIFHCIGDIYDCYILHAKSLDRELVPFCKNVSLQPFYWRDEELEEQSQNRENQDRHHSNRDAGFTDLIDFLLRKVKIYRKSTIESINLENIVIFQYRTLL